MCPSVNGEEQATEGSTDAQEPYIVSFEAMTTEGDVFNSEAFAQSELTMINVWATYCNPCLSEMPDLGEIAAAYDKAKFQMIGVISDVMEESDEADIEYARDLIARTQANYPHLLLNESLYVNLIGAVASCPLGALQAALNQKGFQVPFAVLGFFFIFGSIFGRFVCGWLCPFGLLQDLLHKIPLFRKRKQLPHHHVLKYGKYVVLVGLVLIGSAFLFEGFAKVPAFCKYLCPSGTFMGAIPLLSANEQLRAQAGDLFYWKLAVLVVLVIASVKVYRPFCQYLCPLGAIYGGFNRFSLVQIQWRQDGCISCMACQRACPVNLPPEQISVSPECIKCGQCVSACSGGCLSFGMKGKNKE